MSWIRDTTDPSLVPSKRNTFYSDRNCCLKQPVVLLDPFQAATIAKDLDDLKGTRNPGTHPQALSDVDMKVRAAIAIFASNPKAHQAFLQAV